MKNTGKKFLSDIKLHSDYLKWKDDLGRYETWGEACESILDGHRQRYAGVDIEEELSSALESMKDMRVFASQRNLQFRGPQIERSNARIFNCSVVHAVTNKVFQNVMFLLMNGCGVGVSLLKPFVENISGVQKRMLGAKTYVIEDSIEGWSDAIGVLLSSYFVDKQPFPEYAGYEVRFDYSLIRPKGSYISGGYKAPGPDELKKSLEKIESFLEVLTLSKSNLSPRDVYDIICMSSDAVISGGVRRSALIMLVDPNDEEMILAKTGNWRQDTPWRARSNNSVMLKRGEAKKEFFEYLLSLNEGDNDIGFVFVDSWFDLMNPCLSGDSKILTKNGEVEISSLDDGQGHVFINALGQEVTGRVKLTGYKPTITLNISNGNKITCTHDHIFIDSEGNELEAQFTKGVKLGHFYHNNQDFDSDFVKYGFLQGDGCLGRLKSDDHKGVEVNLGQDDEDVRKFFGITSTDRSFYLSDGTKEKLVELGFSGEKLPFRKLPSTINKWTKKQKLSFLRGLWSANGCIIKNKRISFKSTCKDLIEYLTILLSELGISSYYTTNKAKKVKFENGEYECRESYDLNIGAYSEIIKFAKNIGFIHSYKNDELATILKQKAPMVRKIVKNKGLEPVYDFSLDDLTHVGVVNGVLTHNCAEIGFTPINVENVDLCSIEYIDLKNSVSNNEDKFGVQFCNLTSMNAEKMTSEEVFLRSCKDAAIIGTLQAGYTSFPYLGETTEAITQREALLGVSMTGWMNNPKMFNPELLRKGARVVKDTNEKLAQKLGINPAARTTCVKPEGNLSVIAGTSSGIHPEHSEQYFRIMQLNKETEVAKYLSQHMPFLLEESVWSAFKTDYVVFIPVKNPREGLFKKDVKGVKHLELVKLVQENWVIEGTRPERGISNKTRHNVSSTIIIDDKKAMVNYLWDNQNIFSGVSFISDFGDKDFNQAPFTSVLSPEQIFEQYGKGALFASGLIVDGLHYFDGNLWQACDCALDKTIPVVGTREQVLLKKSWLDRAKKFAKNYFKGDMKKMVYCLKDVHLSHKWETINRQMKDVDFSKILPKPEYVSPDKYAGIACSGKDGCTVNVI